jgi:hypothetical protein
MLPAMRVKDRLLDGLHGIFARLFKLLCYILRTVR